MRGDVNLPSAPCPACHGTKCGRVGVAYESGVKYTTYRCADCGHEWTLGTSSLLLRPWSPPVVMRFTNTPPLLATISCSSCGKPTIEPIPTDACVRSYVCPHCLAVLEPPAGGCCVFCAYSDKTCPLCEREQGELINLGTV